MYGMQYGHQGYLDHEPLSPGNKSTVLLQASLKTQSYHGEIILLQVPKYFIYPKSQICITRLLKIILNAQLISTYR